jgi:hypothetical protein
MDIQDIINKLIDRYKGTFKLRDLLRVSAPDKVIKGAFLRDLAGNPIDDRSIACLEDDGRFTYKNEGERVDFTLTNQTRKAEAEADFKEIYEREFSKKKLPDTPQAHALFRTELIVWVKKLVNLHKEEHGFEDQDARLLLLAEQFNEFLQNSGTGSGKPEQEPPTSSQPQNNGQIHYFNEFITEIRTLNIKVRSYNGARYLDLSQYEQGSEHNRKLEVLKEMAINEVFSLENEKLRQHLRRLERIEANLREFWGPFKKMSEAFWTDQLGNEFLEAEIYPFFIIPEHEFGNVSKGYPNFIYDLDEAVSSKQTALRSFIAEVRGAVGFDSSPVGMRSGAAPVPDSQEQDVLTKSTDKLKTELKNHGFFDLPMVASLTSEKVNRLIDLFVNSDLPYQIAFVEHLEFVKYLDKVHFKSAKKRNEFLAGIFNSGERAIKGNLSVLVPNSKENRNRYTAHSHKEAVERDYKSLK